jgi:hypothetical protein
MGRAPAPAFRSLAKRSAFAIVAEVGLQQHQYNSPLAIGIKHEIHCFDAQIGVTVLELRIAKASLKLELVYY